MGEHNPNMRKHNIICLIICLLGGVVGVLLKVMPRTVPYELCSEVYKTYSQIGGVRAAYIKDFRVNDTVTVGVTLLEATTDSGWAVLQEDFEVPAIPKEYEAIFYGDSTRVTVKNYPKNAPIYVDGDTLKDDILAISYYKHAICHFEIQDKVQSGLILHKHYDDNIRNDNLKHSNHEKID